MHQTFRRCEPVIGSAQVPREDRTLQAWKSGKGIHARALAATPREMARVQGLLGARSPDQDLIPSQV